MELYLEDIHQFHGNLYLMVNWKQVMDQAFFFLLNKVDNFKNSNALEKIEKFGTVKITCHLLEEWT
jgi:hypothetical protein